MSDKNYLEQLSEQISNEMDAAAGIIKVSAAIKNSYPKEIVDGVVQSENLVAFDVDQTLVLETNDLNNPNHKIMDFNFYGQTRTYRVATKTVDFLKSLHSRGYFIIIWSGNGYQWAHEVAKKLDLLDHKHIIMSKLTKLVDDKDVTDWMPKRIYLPEDAEGM